MTSVRTSLNGFDRSFLFQYIAPNTVGLEVGVWRGEFSYAITKHVALQRLHLVDAWVAYPTPFGVIKTKDSEEGAEEQRYQEVLARFAPEIASGKVVVHRQLSAAAASNFPDNYFDWVYIDAGHSYEDVKDDLDAYVPKVKVGGYIMGDDYNPVAWPGVVRAVDELRALPSIETVDVKTWCQSVLKKIA